MADLMSGTYTYSSLAEKYKDFLTPAFKIKIEGSDAVASLKMAVENVSVSLSLENSSTCSFTIVNAYDLKQRCFRSDMKSKLILGAKVEVELGYQSSLLMVFKGYITEISAEFSGAPQLTVTAMDVRRLMMEGNRIIEHQVKNYSDAFTTVMKKYSALCSQQEVDATDENFKDDSVSQHGSDYEFIRLLARASKREFFVLGDTAYFRNPAKAKQAIISLEWGKDLISFSRDSLYQVIEIKVIGFDESKKEVVKAEAKEKSNEKLKQAVSEAPTHMVVDPLATDAKKAQKKAEALAAERKRKGQHGQGVCIGLPEIVPGRFIKVTKLDPDVDNSYYIKSVNHQLGSDGFTTSFEIGGWQ